ncbi:MAG: ribonuclease HI [Bdellovibrionales bacterium]|nr:ribonuclease HI [Bdellovibrionales bacterium]
MGKELNLPLAEVLERFHEGPVSGIFTDGSARPNPGRGGWGIVYVEENEIIEQAYGSEEYTTNNIMELTALIQGVKLAPKDKSVTLYSDSQLCVNTINEWAHGWERRGWKRKTGPIANLELVKELYYAFYEHKNLSLEWVRAHNGWRWNEYADSLATAWDRSNL